ncbi:MAG: hypothetical protein KH353_11325 [Clostridium sp.]|nr:hypothetical protein [Clostridium sp.]
MKKINFYIFVLALLCFMAGCSSASPNAEKQNTVNYLNSIRTQIMKAESGSLTINTEWNIGDESETVGRHIDFSHRDSKLYYKETIYDSSADNSAKPYQTAETSEDGASLIISSEDDNITVEVPLEQAPSLEQFFKGIWDTLNPSEIEHIETAEQGEITSYTIIYSSDYCSSKGNETEIGSSVLQSKILELELTPDETVKAVKLNTAGYVSELNSPETPVSQKTELYLD